MASDARDNFELMPVLVQASIGNFECDIKIDPSHPMEVNELLAGVQVMVEVVRERELENARLKQELRQTRSPVGLIKEFMEGGGKEL
jgi:hypothetical protein